MMLFVLGMFFGSFFGVAALAMAKAAQDAPEVLSLTDREQMSGNSPTHGDKTPNFPVTPRLVAV